MQDWDIKSRGSACGGCARAFEDRETYYSALTFGEQGYVRTDYCEPCWQKQAAPSDGLYSIWQGVFRAPPPKPEEPLKKETAETLLRRLMEAPDPSQINVVFILAVMLERKKILDEKDVQLRDGETIRVYEHRKSGEVFVVQDPLLRLDQIQMVQEQVIQMLEGGSKSTAAGDASPPPAEPGTNPPQPPPDGEQTQTPG